VQSKKLPSHVIKELDNWQLFTLVSKQEVMGIFLTGLEWGNEETGRPFSSIAANFYHSLKLCGLKHRKLRQDYARICKRTREPDKENP
jgi:hypothetical protein